MNDAGFIAAFDSSGKLLGTVKGDQFNAPWGMAMVTQFAAFPNALGVGNFGDGAITAIDPVKMTVLGQPVGATGAPLQGEAGDGGVQSVGPGSPSCRGAPDRSRSWAGTRRIA